MADDIDLAGKATDVAPKAGGLWDTVKVILQALLLALIVRTFLYQPFNIPSGSMKSTLLVGDYLFVSKFAYGYSKHSFPFNAVPIEGRVWGAMPQRGDVVVFKLPRDGTTDYIKRVIGLPGDRVQVTGGQLFLNGQAVPRVKTDDFVETDAFGNQTRVTRYRETIDGREHDILDLVQNGIADDTPVFEVPAGHIFVMGDNRDNSTDSRFLSQVGYVPIENIVGRAEVLFFSIEEDASAWQVWTWPWTVRWNRLFNGL